MWGRYNKGWIAETGTQFSEPALQKNKIIPVPPTKAEEETMNQDIKTCNNDKQAADDKAICKPVRPNYWHGTK